MIKEVKTEKSFDEVVSTVENVCKSNKFGVLKTYEFHNLLEEKGHPISKKITVFEICNPSYAKQILEQESLISNFMPCKITVIEEENGVKISTYDIDKIVQQFNNKEVNKIAGEVKQIIDNIIKELS